VTTGQENDGDNVVLPYSTSARRNLSDYIDTTGAYNMDIMPTASVYEEYQIQCYRMAYAEENATNILTLDEVQGICDWVIEQDEQGNLPQITGKQVVAVEPFPFNPQVAGRDVDSNLWKWYFTLRITYVNTAQGRSI
jgi:hypothetical protein